MQLKNVMAIGFPWILPLNLDLATNLSSGNRVEGGIEETPLTCRS
jgi:hypothetical protein